MIQIGLSAARKKDIRSLAMAKSRQKYGKFVAEGQKIAIETIEQRPELIFGLYATVQFLDFYGMSCLEKGIACTEISEKELSEISQLQTPNQVLLVIETPETTLPKADTWLLYADQLRDPGNLGTLWRIADWFGISQLICSPESADLQSAKVVQASMGAFLRVPSCTMALPDLLARLPHSTPVYGAVLDGVNLYQHNENPPGIIVIGSESHGLTAATEALLTQKLTIAGGGGAESLNAAVAAGVICSWLLR